jgi:CheY-like chemotaxis protein
MSLVKKILIAEDELLIAKVLRMQLEKLGYEVQNVVDSHQAILSTLEFNPDMIILDVFLKNNTTGIDSAIKIRELGIDTPIIFTTGNSYDETIELVSKINYSMILSKPVEFDHLLQLIEDF